jgi:hypothetical protein
VVAKDPPRHHRDLDIKDCRFKNHAVIVKKNNLYRGTDYSHERVNNRAAAFIDSFRREAGINSRVIPDLKTRKQRFAFDARDAKKMQRPTAGTPLARIKSDDHLWVKKNPAIQNITIPPGHTKTTRQPLGTLPARTRKSPDIQIIRGTSVSTFKPIQRYKPDITIRMERTKLPPPPERKGQIGIPGGEPRQVLPKMYQQRPSTNPGFTFQKQASPRTYNVQRHESPTRLKAERPSAYKNQGYTNRSFFSPTSPGFGRR